LVGIVVVSHSAELARGVAELAGQMAGPEVRIEVAGGSPTGGLGTDFTAVTGAIERADQGHGVICLGDLGSAILTIRSVLDNQENGHVKLVDAPGVELNDVAKAAEEARGARKF
jgi:PTS hybrid protein